MLVYYDAAFIGKTQGIYMTIKVSSGVSRVFVMVAYIIIKKNIYIYMHTYIQTTFQVKDTFIFIYKFISWPC